MLLAVLILRYEYPSSRPDGFACFSDAPGNSWDSLRGNSCTSDIRSCKNYSWPRTLAVYPNSLEGILSALFLTLYLILIHIQLICGHCAYSIHKYAKWFYLLYLNESSSEKDLWSRHWQLSDLHRSKPGPGRWLQFLDCILCVYH